MPGSPHNVGGRWALPVGVAAVFSIVMTVAVLSRWGLLPGVVVRGDRIPTEEWATEAFREAYFRVFKEELPADDLVDIVIVPGDPSTRGNPQHIVQLAVGSESRERARRSALPLKHKYSKAYKKHGGDPSIYFHID